MKFSELKKKVNAGEIKPFYVLTGKDEYLKSSALKILKSKVAMPELNVSVLESPTSLQLRDALCSMPMMSDLRLVQTDKLTEINAISSYADSPTPTSVFVVTDPPETRRGKKPAKKEEEIVKFLARAEEIDCSPLDLPTIFGWIGAEAKRYEVQVERDAAALLAEYCKNDMSRITGEFRKLASYRMGGTVTEDDVRELVEPELEYAVWQLSSAIASGNAREALRIYDSFGEDAKKPEILFGAVYSHFRKLFYAAAGDDDALKKELGVRDNVLFAVKREAGKFGKPRLKRILLSLADMDEDMKNGTVPREIASEMLVLKTISEI